MASDRERDRPRGVWEDAASWAAPRAEVHDRLDTVEAYVTAKPLPAVAIAAAAGIVIGLLLRGRSRTIYLRDAR